MGRCLGLVIGVNQYQDAAFRPLQYAETDARAIAQWLVNERGGKWQPADVQVVLGTHATRELVETLITQLCVNIAAPGDLVLIYFAGHTFLDEKTGDGYLALANTSSQQPATALHLPSLARRAMSQSPAANIVFMLDCFQTGQLWNARRQFPYDFRPLLGPSLLSALQQNSGRLLLCSCRGNDFAAEAGEKNLGMLAYHMIIGLCGPASDPVTGQFTLQRLQAFLFNSLAEQQRPQIFGQEHGQVVLVGSTTSLPSLSSSAPIQNTQQSGPQTSTPYATVATQTAPAPLQRQNTTGSLMAQANLRPMAEASFPQQMSPFSTTTDAIEKQRQEQSAALLQQARSAIQMQNAAGAFQLIEQALQLTPNDLNVIILKGQLLGTVGRFQEALYTVETAMRLDDHNALLWSMYAALLTNVGRYPDALSAIERSLELDANNPETYSIKTSIMGHIAAQSMNNNQQESSRAKRGGPVSFFIAAGIGSFGLLIGIVGAVIPILQPHLPIVAGDSPGEPGASTALRQCGTRFLSLRLRARAIDPVFQYPRFRHCWRVVQVQIRKHHPGHHRSPAADDRVSLPRPLARRRGCRPTAALHRRLYRRTDPRRAPQIMRVLQDSVTTRPVQLKLHGSRCYAVL